MLAALLRLTLRHLRAHAVRSLLTVAGVGLGVTGIVGVRLLHGAAADAYATAVDRIAGKAVLQVTNGDVGVPETLLEELRATPGVGAVAASVQGLVSRLDGARERLYVLGVDLLADRELREYQLSSSQVEVEDPLVFLSQPNSVAVTADFAARNGLELGTELPVRSPQGPVRMIVRATFDARRGPASVYGGRLIVMDIFAAQRLLGAEGRFTQIDLGLAPAARLEDVEAAVTRVVAGRGRVEPSALRGQALDQLLAANRHAWWIATMLIVAVSGYMIFNTLMTSVMQRLPELGTLRLLGLRRADVVALVSVEAGLLGLFGTVMGVALGTAFARAAAPGLSLSVSNLYLPLDVPEVPVRTRDLLWALAWGLGFVGVAAVVPALEAAAVPPLMRQRRLAGEQERRVLVSRRGVALLLALAAAVVVGLVWAFRRQVPPAGGPRELAAILAVLVVVAVLFRSAVGGFARAIERLVRSVAGDFAMLASRNVAAERRRVGITAAAFALSIGGGIIIAGWMSSLDATMTAWIDGLFARVHLIVGSGTELLAPSTPLPGEIVDQIGRLPDVERVDGVRTVKVAYGGSLTKIVAADTRMYRDGYRRLRLVDGDPQEVIDTLIRGDGVTVNEAFVRRFPVSRGGRLRLETASGPVELPVAAVIFDLSFGDMGFIGMDRSLYRRLWADDKVDLVQAVLRHPEDSDRVAETIQRELGERFGLFVLSIDEFRRDNRGLLAQSSGMAGAIVVMAICVAIFGLVNALNAAVLDRQARIGMLRAIGATRVQLVRLLMVEGGVIAALGVIIGLTAGNLLGAAATDLVFRGLLGISLLYRSPWEIMVVAAVGGIVAAVLAAYAPGRRAARLVVTNALAHFE